MANITQISGLDANSSYLCQSSSTQLVLPLLYTLLFLTGLPANALSLWVFTARISDKTPSHIYLINLGISNLALCLTSPFLAAYYAVGMEWRARHTVCKLAINVLTPLVHINICTGMLILTCLALSRFALLVRHTHAARPIGCVRLGVFRQLCHVHTAWFNCLAIWFLVVVLIIPTMVMYSMMETGRPESEAEEACYSVPVELGGSGSQTISLVGPVVFFLCFLLVLSSYAALVRHLCKSRRSMAISTRERVYARAFRNITVIQLVLAVCLLPYHIFKAAFIGTIQQHHLAGPHVTNRCHPLSTYVEIKNALLCLAVLRCSTDPVMSFLLDSTFRKHVLSLLRIGRDHPGSQTSRHGGQTSQGSRAQTLCGVTDNASMREAGLNSPATMGSAQPSARLKPCEVHHSADASI